MSFIARLWTPLSLHHKTDQYLCQHFGCCVLFYREQSQPLEPYPQPVSVTQSMSYLDTFNEFEARTARHEDSFARVEETESMALVIRKPKKDNMHRSGLLAEIAGGCRGLLHKRSYRSPTVHLSRKHVS